MYSEVMVHQKAESHKLSKHTQSNSILKNIYQCTAVPCYIAVIR